MNANDDAPRGYGHPPKSNRFKPGHSGNAKGRPIGTRNVKTDLTNMLNKRVPIREDGELRHVSRQEAMLLALYRQAIQGDTRAAIQLLTMVTKTETQETSRSQADVVTDNDRAIVEDFLKRNLAVKKEGEPCNRLRRPNAMPSTE